MMMMNHGGGTRIIVLTKLLHQPWKKHPAYQIIGENNNFCFETPINSKITGSVLINLTRSPRKKDSRGHPSPPRKLPLFFEPPPPPLWISVALRAGRGMDIFWNYTILLVKRGTRLLKFQPMHCTVLCFSSQQLACCCLFCLNWRFFNTTWRVSRAFYCKSGRSRVWLP